jgi:pimeloyl-ACP methyl ester carboxylesterase
MPSVLPSEQHGGRVPSIVFLHWLGGSARTWGAVASGLATRGYSCVAFDLPGFGHAVDDTRWTVGSAADAVAASVASLNPGCPWILVGHSMGGKIAAVLARWAADGDDRLATLIGLVLVSPSPPSVEPMSDSKRKGLVHDLGRSTGSVDEDRRRASRFVVSNVGHLSLPTETADDATLGVLAMNRDACTAWLTGGSREDWSERVGRLPQPMLLLCGEVEADLGEVSARRLAAQPAPNKTPPRIVVLPGTGHLAPLERPGELIEHIAAFAASLEIPSQLPVVMLERNIAELVASPWTSPRTRSVMNARLAPESPSLPTAFDGGSMEALRALVARVVPGAPCEIAVRVARALTDGRGDGWRLSSLPDDLTAWRRGLATIDALSAAAHGVRFVALDASRQDGVLHALEAGDAALGGVPSPAPHFDAADRAAWFMEARVEIVRTYMSDPRTMARVGFRGFADERGFTRIRLGEKEDFET